MILNIKIKLIKFYQQSKQLRCVTFVRYDVVQVFCLMYILR